MPAQRRVQLLYVLIWPFLLALPLCAVGKDPSCLNRPQNPHKKAPQRVVVLFNHRPDPNILSKFDATLIHKFKTINALVCEMPPENVEPLKRNESIENVVPDILVTLPHPQCTLTGPTGQSPQQNPLAPLSYEGPVTVQWNNLPAGLNAQAAWNNYDVNGTTVKIAFLDQGINYNLPDLNDNYLGGYDYVSDDNDPINDTSGEAHGTEVSSLAVAEGQSKIVGAAYNAGYYAVRVLDSSGAGYVTDVIAAIEWAIDPDADPNTDDKADIISMSFGIYGHELPSYLKNQWRNACNAAYDAGIVLVAGSGNDACDLSLYPAAFENVISVGAHNQSQNVWSSSNGAVDVVAPGQTVLVLKPDNSTVYETRTSFAVPHVSALIALQTEYAQKNNIKLNNGYHWQVMNHSAVDLDADPNYQGAGKIYAAHTDANDPNLGSIDLIASNWPIDYDFLFEDFAFIDNNIPVYQIGRDVNQTIILTNITHILGNTPEDIENLDVTATQLYYNQPNEPNLPGTPTKVFPTINLLEPADANSVALSLTYSIPPQTLPGPKTTKLDFEFNFTGSTRTLKISYNQPPVLWYAAIPGDIALDDKIDLLDFASLADRWRQTDCNEPNWCDGADIDKTTDVNWPDLDIITESWLSGF